MGRCSDRSQALGRSPARELAEPQRFSDTIESARTARFSNDMPIDSQALSSLAADYAKGMTSIRGRRVQRLLKREFGGADQVFLVQADSDSQAVLGLSESGAAWCATDGRGRHASVVKWRHGWTQALESRFDLLKDSLPLLAAETLPLTGRVGQIALRVRRFDGASGWRLVVE